MPKPNPTAPTVRVTKIARGTPKTNIIVDGTVNDAVTQVTITEATLASLEPSELPGLIRRALERESYKARLDVNLAKLVGVTL